MKKLTTLPTPTRGAAGRTRKPTSGVRGGDYPIRIGDYRKRAGLTQAALATRIGCTREHLCRIERGRVFMTEIVERRIARHLSLSNDDQLIAFGYPTRPSSTVRDDDEEAGGAAAPIDLTARRAGRVGR